jgi:hypothetical protein
MRQIPEHVDPLSCEISKKMWIDEMLRLAFCGVSTLDFGAC